MTDQRAAEAVRAGGRQAEQSLIAAKLALAAAARGTPEAMRLRSESARFQRESVRLRSEYRRLIDAARRARRPEIPPWPSGLAAARDGAALVQASPPHPALRESVVPDPANARYHGQWVAISDSRVVASGATATEILERVRGLDIGRIEIHKVGADGPAESVL
jgi:hypothetical protein